MSEPVAASSARQAGQWKVLGFTSLMLTTLVPAGFFYVSLLVAPLVRCTPYFGVSAGAYGVGLLLFVGGIVLAAVVLFARPSNPAKTLAVVALGVAIGPALIGGLAGVLLFVPLAPPSCG